MRAGLVRSGGAALLAVLVVYAVEARSQGAGWAEAVDAAWGPGAPVAEHLDVFDAVWTHADTTFAAFATAPADWDGLRARYRTEVEGGVSRGRFAAILNHLALGLRESHTFALDSVVNVVTEPAPGVPLLYGPVRGDNGHFGACLTPLADGSLLVYAVADGHPLGLEPGDLVLGYDGRPWDELYRELLAAELPVYLGSGSVGGDPPGWSRSLWGTAPSAYEAGWQSAAGMNWHLFDRLDVVRRGADVAASVAVAPLAEADLPIRCTEQLPVPGVPRPAPTWSPGVRSPSDAEHGEYVSSGVVEDTRVGYVYVWSWYWGDVRGDFQAAIERFVADPEIDGLIVDVRFNHGGFASNANAGLGRLFSEDVETLEMLERATPDDRQTLVRAPPFAGRLEVAADPSTSFDRPIAVLTGPGAFSAGDFNALRLRYHPRARAFGRPTAGAFTPALPVRLQPGYSAAVAFGNAQRVDRPGHPLVHSEQAPDETVWLRPDDVAAGNDTVVRHALDWIARVATDADSGPSAPPLALSPPIPNPTTVEATVSLSVPNAGEVRVALYDLLGREVRVVSDGPRPAGQYRLAVRTDGLASGVYLLRAQSGGGVAVQKVSVAR